MVSTLCGIHMSCGADMGEGAGRACGIVIALLNLCLLACCAIFACVIYLVSLHSSI